MQRYRQSNILSWCITEAEVAKSWVKVFVLCLFLLLHLVKPACFQFKISQLRGDKREHYPRNRHSHSHRNYPKWCKINTILRIQLILWAKLSKRLDWCRPNKKIDLLQKSWFEFEVVDGSDQIEAQPKAFSPITVTLTQDPKDFQLADDILDQNAFPGQLAVGNLLLCAQRMKFTFLGWRLAVGVQAGQSLIASIGYNANRSRYSRTALFEQLKIMVAAVTEVRG